MVLKFFQLVLKTNWKSMESGFWKFVETLAGFPHGFESTELWNRFSRPWESIEFGQTLHKVLKKYKNSKFSLLFIQFFFFTADNNFADVFCIVFHE